MKVESNLITISIVSHGQFDLMRKLLIELKSFSKIIDQVIITINIPEEVFKNDYDSNLFTWINNTVPLGFGENHNQAFQKCKSKYFCIMNPDILLQNNNVFTDLLKFKEKYNVGIIGPSLVDSLNKKQINARKFPTLITRFIYLFKKPSEFFYLKNDNLGLTDWIGGMFMLIKSEDYKNIGGFDQRFFLYYEDVDICNLAKNKGMTVAELTKVKVIHDARRASHKNFKYFCLHLNSCIKYFLKYILK